METTLETSRLKNDSSLSAVIEQYHETGYTALRGVFSADEIAAWQAESDALLHSDLVSEDNLRTSYRDLNGSKMIERIDPVVDVSTLFAELVRDERIISVVREIFADEPLLFKDKLIFKLPGMSGYNMHQDEAWWQLCPPDDILSVSIQLDGADSSNGCIELFPGYQHQLLSPPGELRNMNDEEIAKIDLSRGELMETKPGDVLIFHSLTPHRSGPNTARHSRRSLYLTYSAQRNGNLYERSQDHYRSYRRAAMSEDVQKRLYFK